MLTEYLTRTRRLLQNPAPAASGIYSDEMVTDYINVARKQLAGESRCIRRIGTIAAVVGQREYQFADIDIGVSATTGIAGIFHVRRINYNSGDGQIYIPPRPWEWFDQFALNNAAPGDAGAPPGARPPTMWAQYGQGGSPPVAGIDQSGSFYLDPIPDDTYALQCDCVCYPIVLADDADPEAIPYIFTDCVPFLAAWYCLLSTQTNARRADAEAYYGYYQVFLTRAQKAVTPDVLAPQYEQAPDPIAGTA